MFGQIGRVPHASAPTRLPESDRHGLPAGKTGEKDADERTAPDSRQRSTQRLIPGYGHGAAVATEGSQRVIAHGYLEGNELAGHFHRPHLLTDHGGMMMFWLKACPRCQGDLHEIRDVGDEYISCLQCGKILTAEQELTLTRRLSQAAARRPAAHRLRVIAA